MKIYRIIQNEEDKYIAQYRCKFFGHYICDWRSITKGMGWNSLEYAIEQIPNYQHKVKKMIYTEEEK